MENALSLLIPVHANRLNPSDQDKRLIAGYLGRFDGKAVQVLFRPPSRNRSTRQNGYYWGICLSMIAAQTGHTMEELHEFFKDKFLGGQYVVIAGEERHVPKSSTGLNTVEFERYLDAIRAFAGQELGMAIPLPNEC